MQDIHEIANALRETAQLLKVKGANKFKAKAYVTAAQVLDTTEEDIKALVDEERLTDLPGVGPAIAGFITDLYKTDETYLLKKLRRELPAGTAELSKVAGLTIKRIAKLSEELKVTSIQELEAACKAGQLAKIKGFGEQAQNEILKAIQTLTEPSSETRLIKARAIGHDLLEHLQTLLPDHQIALAGNIRVWQETVNTIEIVTDAPKEAVETCLHEINGVVKIKGHENSLLVSLAHGVPVQVFCVSNFPLGLIAHTGDRKHFQQLKEHALAKNFLLDDSGLYKGQRKIVITSESAVYEKLGLHFVPPELRQGTNELEIAKTPDFNDLIKTEDICGMTHCHTTFSDGIHTVEEMARYAEKMGMKYVTITDHSPTASYAGGLTLDRLKEQWEEIDRVQEKVKIRILKGTECDILSDGKLDYPDKILEQFDIIIASIHSRYRQGEEAMTRRLLNALRNPFFKVWGHPLGRILLSRDPIPCNVRNVLHAITDARVAIEINGDPYRMDLPAQWAQLASEIGFRFIISTDAHSTGNYHNLKYGIHLARQARIKKSAVLNATATDEFCSLVRPN
ncbi:MAG TPA: PHP domain-containing protein [Oculatellaceae cyanobacterium]